MAQQPSTDWIRRTLPLNGTEDLLSQNPPTDASPQESRIPTDLVAEYAASKLNIVSLGEGVAVARTKDGYNLNFRSIAASSNRVSVVPNGGVIMLDANASNIASGISLTMLNDVAAPTANGQYLTYNGSGYSFSNQTYGDFKIKDYLNNEKTIENGGFVKFLGSNGLTTTLDSINSTITYNFNGGLQNLNNVYINGVVPNGYVLGWNNAIEKWEPTAPYTPPASFFNVSDDFGGFETITSGDTINFVSTDNIDVEISSSNEIIVSWNADLGDLSNVSNISPSNGQYLIYNSTNSRWEPTTISSPASYSSTNGIYQTGNTFGIGGNLTKNTQIFGSNYAFDLLDLKEFELTTTKSNKDGQILLNVVAGQGELSITDNTTGFKNGVYIISSSSTTTLSAISPSNTSFKAQVDSSAASLFFQEGSTQKCGFFVNSDGIIVKDGVNTTPTVGQVLTYTNLGTVEFKTPTGSGFGDNWGTQVVETDDTLSGNGTVGNLLRVANPLPDLGNEGDVLSISSGIPTWVANASQREFVCLNEVERGSEVSVMDGKLFFVVPPQLNGWKLDSLIASVDTVGVSGSTVAIVAKNGTNITASTATITSQSVSVSGINETVLVGNRISVNITSAKATKDKGLSLTLLFKP